MCIKKETFVKTIELIQKQEEINFAISKAMDPICEGNGFFYDGGRYYSKALLMVLSEVMNDKKDSWIEWWLYENGREAWDKDGNKITLETPEQLYDHLLNLKEGD